MSQGAPLAYMLDTNVCIHVMTGRVEGVRERLSRIPPQQVIISALVLAELRFGIHASAAERRSENMQALNDFLAMVAVDDWDWPADTADLYGHQRAALKARGLPIGANDLLIGCHALHLGRVLVTQKRREFERLDGLQVESWVD